MEGTTILIIVLAVSVVIGIVLFIVNKQQKIKNVQGEFQEIFLYIKKIEEDIETNRKNIRESLVNAAVNVQANAELTEQLSSILNKIEEDSDKALAVNKELHGLVSKVYYRHPTLKNT